MSWLFNIFGKLFLYNQREETKYILITSDEIQIEVSANEIIHFKTFQQMIENLQYLNEPSVELLNFEIPLRYDSYYIKKIVEWIRSFNSSEENKAMLKHSLQQESLSSLMILIEACLYLNIEELKNILSEHVSNIVQHMNSQEVKAIFGREKELTQSQRLKIKKIRHTFAAIISFKMANKLVKC